MSRFGFTCVALLAWLLPSPGRAQQVPVAPKNGPSATRWVDPSILHPGPIQPSPLTPEQLRRIKLLQLQFADVDPSPPQKWVDDFRRDLDPDREIAVWEALAKAYTAYCSGKTLSLAAKDEIYSVLLNRSGASEEDVLAHVSIKVLSRDQAREVMRLYDKKLQPVQVERR